MKNTEWKKTQHLGLLWTVLLLVLPVLTMLIALCIGRMKVPPRDVLCALTGSDEISEIAKKTVLSLRLPRVLLAMLVGAGLSVAGCTFQSLFANPLATPDTLGISSGASFGAALGILLGLKLPGIQLLSLLMGLTAVLLTWLTGSGRGRGLSSVVLAGIMIGSLFTALVSLVKFTADSESQLPAITYWLMGGLDKASFSTLKFGAPTILVGMAVLFLLRWRLNLLPLSEDEVRASGVSLRALRSITVLCATAVTAACVALCGQVGWVGLLVPHMCRMKFGGNHRKLLPACISLGAVFMLVVDTIARSVTAAEIPVSVLTAIIGAPFFIVLMRRSGGWSF